MLRASTWLVIETTFTHKQTHPQTLNQAALLLLQLARAPQADRTIDLRWSLVGPSLLTCPAAGRLMLFQLAYIHLERSFAS